MNATEVVLTRTIRAPRSLVFEAWTHPEHLQQWFAPKDFTITGVISDPRPGGILRFCHISPGFDAPVWVRGEYKVVDPPTRVVYTLGFSDAESNAVTRPGFALESTVDVTLEERDGVTEVTVRHSGLPREQGERQGWTESLDRLAALLESP